MRGTSLYTRAREERLCQRTQSVGARGARSSPPFKPLLSFQSGREHRPREKDKKKDVRHIASEEKMPKYFPIALHGNKRIHYG